MDLDRENDVKEAYRKYDPGWKIAPYDARYPHQSQFKHCIQSFIDYYRCKQIKGDDYTNCFYFRRVAEQMCPKVWRDKWLTQIREGRFEYVDMDKNGRLLGLKNVNNDTIRDSD